MSRSNDKSSNLPSSLRDNFPDFLFRSIRNLDNSNFRRYFHATDAALRLACPGLFYIATVASSLASFDFPRVLRVLAFRLSCQRYRPSRSRSRSGSSGSLPANPRARVSVSRAMISFDLI
jgi:hypothetical protein